MPRRASRSPLHEGGRRQVWLGGSEEVEVKCTFSMERTQESQLSASDVTPIKPEFETLTYA